MEDPEEAGPQTLCKGRYIFKRFIGKGSHGAVFMYEDKTLNSPCAVKIENLGKKSIRMLNETHYLRKVSSNMDRFPEYIYDSQIKEVSGLRRFLIMKFIDRSLNDYVKEMFGSQGYLLFENLAQQMLESIKQVHMTNRIHREIKPENFRVIDDKVYIVGFGSIVKYQDSSGLLL